MTAEVDVGPGARRLAELVGRVTDDELAKPTPCPAYTLGDLIDNVGGLALAFTAAARKESGRHVEQAPSGQASRLEPGWRTRIPADLQALASAWSDPEAWTGMTRCSPARMLPLARTYRSGRRDRYQTTRRHSTAWSRWQAATSTGRRPTTLAVRHSGTAASSLHRSSPARAEAPCSIWALSSAPIRIASPVK
jgi:Mycothiol maleylpyruvate isomerase N-terminal domain